jgi:hypothetical protein
VYASAPARAAGRQNAKNNIAPELAGSDNCPGTAIAGGTYTAAAPFTDTGNTTGANDTITSLSGVGGGPANVVSGPDLVYSFTLTARGANPEIKLTPSGPTYEPSIYILQGTAGGGGCPAGTGSQSVANWLVLVSSTGGGPSTIPASVINTLPLNVPLYLFIDSKAAAPNGSGAYTLRIQDLTVAPPAAKAPFDFDRDGKTDIGIFRPSVGEWWYRRSSDGIVPAFQFGAAADKIIPGDYTGDGKTDIAFFRPSTGEWFVLRSEDSSYFSFPFGAIGSSDVPVPADFNGDGITDVAIFRPASGTWYIQTSSNTTITTFGTAGDVPVVADYDGDGKADIAIYRPSAGEWWIQRSTAGLVAFRFGTATDKPVQGDYTGDGKADAAFFRPSTGEWFIARSEDNSATFYSFPFGAGTDTPVPGDYDGDGKFDAAVFRSSNATWYLQRSTAGTQIITFGVPTDRPVPNAFVP